MSKFDVDTRIGFDRKLDQRMSHETKRFLRNKRRGTP